MMEDQEAYSLLTSLGIIVAFHLEHKEKNNYPFTFALKKF